MPNLNITQFSAGHTSSANPFIRGIGLQDHLITTDPGVSVYVDGVYLGRQVGQNWSLSNLERIEVLRGPQGTLFGRNTPAGIVKFDTRKPTREFDATFRASYGTYDTMDVQGAVGFPISSTVSSGVGSRISRYAWAFPRRSWGPYTM